MNKSTKRILTDIIEYNESPIDGTHIWFDENDISLIKILIIGPKDTPYEGGFYCFRIQFPKSYPNNPPLVCFLNMHRGIRFHPNLYSNGKVCLSILGTWQGPPWTSTMTLTSLIISLKSLFDNNPIRFEPGYENINVNAIINTKYSSAVEYYNLSMAINYVLMMNPFPEFNHVIKQYLYEGSFNKLIEKFKAYDDVSFSCIYSMVVKANYQHQAEKLEKIVMGI
uniref:E2 ubiquitin-conjugating enzyme n=1 Tax=Megaviridae environmental sample TaxID=1737588 RepID=A0A5J6VIC4_9VIRU|nr:MAG: ubiquitin-conjugating enzyme [Megaviridae environmental sample]